MKRYLATVVCACSVGIAAAQGGGGQGLNQGWAKVRTVDDVCADTPQAAPCMARAPGLQKLVTPTFGQRGRARVSRQYVVPPVPQRRAAAASVQRIAAPLQLPAGDPRSRFFHARTAIAAGVNLKAWREGGLYDKVAEQLKTAGAPGGWEAFRPMLEELDEAWILLDSTSKQGQPLVLLTGRFENPMWRMALSSRSPLTGANAVLVGDPLAVNVAQRRLKLAVGVPNKMAQEAAELSKGNDLWVVGVPALMPKNTKGGTQAGPMVDSVQRFSFAMNVRERVNGELNLHTTNAAAAEQLLAFYRMMETQAAASNPKEWAPVAKALSVDQEAATLRFKLSLDPNELAPVLAERMKGVQAPALAAQQRRNAHGQGMMIRIQGLEDGPREIPLNGRQ